MSSVSKFLNTIRDNTLSYRLYKFINRRRHFFYLKDENLRAAQLSSMVYKKLKKKYNDVLGREIPVSERRYNNTVWVCWFQGIENAPLLCQVCVARIREVFGEENVVIISKDNFREYTHIPDYIIEKWEKGIITNTHFSDILRVALLSENGGTWIDATILILQKDLPKYFYDSELFIFADYISDIYPNIQSSYISAYTGSRIMNCARELMYAYWKRENYLLDYSLFHLFFQMAEERYPDEWNKVYKYPNHSTHILRKSLFDQFDPDRFEEIRDVCPIQKLTYKKQIPEDCKGSFYDVLISNNSDFSFMDR